VVAADVDDLGLFGDLGERLARLSGRQRDKEQVDAADLLGNKRLNRQLAGRMTARVCPAVDSPPTYAISNAGCPAQSLSSSLPPYPLTPTIPIFTTGIVSGERG